MEWVFLSVLMLLLMSSFTEVKDGYPKRYRRRRRLQSIFKSFAQIHANAKHTNNIEQETIDTFWSTTHDTWKIFASREIQLLRQMLHQQSEALMTTNQILRSSNPDDTLHIQHLQRRDSILTWFDIAARSLDQSFAQELLTKPTPKDHLREWLHAIARAIRV